MEVATPSTVVTAFDVSGVLMHARVVMKVIIWCGTRSVVNGESQGHCDEVKHELMG